MDLRNGGGLKARGSGRDLTSLESGRSESCEFRSGTVWAAGGRSTRGVFGIAARDVEERDGFAPRGWRAALAVGVVVGGRARRRVRASLGLGRRRGRTKRVASVHQRFADLIGAGPAARREGGTSGGVQACVPDRVGTGGRADDSISCREQHGLDRSVLGELCKSHVADDAEGALVPGAAHEVGDLAAEGFDSAAATTLGEDGLFCGGVVK